MYKLITLDMDGTLLSSKKEILPATFEALKKAAAKGVHIAVSTGRNKAELQDYPELLKVMKEGIIISGAVIYDFAAQKVIEDHPMERAYCQKINAVTRGRELMLQVHTLHDATISSYALDHMADYAMKDYIPMYKRVAHTVDDIHDYLENIHEKVYKINIYHTSPEEREKTYTAIKDLPLEMVNAETTALECSPAHVSKGLGLMALCHYLNIDRDETMVFGDADNDIEILKRAGLSVAMGNANEHVKEICDIITDDNDHDGIAKVINEYILE